MFQESTKRMKAEIKRTGPKNESIDIRITNFTKKESCNSNLKI